MHDAPSIHTPDTGGPAAREPSPPPRIAAIARAFLTPRRDLAPPRPPSLPDARARRFATRVGEVAAVDAGAGPVVLLVHGWEGQASDLDAIGRAVVDAGLRAVAVDLPAHGASDGTWTSIPASARALVDVQRQLGALHAVVAHSVGAAVGVEALHLGMAAGRAALLAAPARYLDYARGFGAQAGLDADDTRRMVTELKRLGVDVTGIAVPERAARMHVPALFVHSADDRVVPMSDALESSAAWPGARLLRVNGLGHRRLLQDAGVVDAVTRFVCRRDTAQRAAA